MNKKEIVGLVEKIKIIGQKEIETYALFDSGARSTSVDTRLAAKARLGPIIKTTRIKNPSLKSETRRPVVKAKIQILNRIFDTEVNIQDRSHMSFPVIVGRNILRGNFIIDPYKNHKLYKKMKK
ncbi:MAG: hypothetical protein DRP13_00130 [Candidatus Aenigmatarchaeota archaeon]|nr:MAG: hypothetical protein DRP13_00130 [Candidatus Aenigmarchaeota archaeon]